MNERAYLREVKRAAPHQLPSIAKTTDPDEQRVLQNYLGVEQYFALRALPVPNPANQNPAAKVFILPGILGSQLWEPGEEVWLNAWSIIKGDFDQLQVLPSGVSRKPITAPGPLNNYYSLLASTVGQNWNTHVFSYDWRMEIRDAALLLKQLIDSVVQPGDQTYFVAHSLGGLVVRSMLQQFPAEQARLARLIMLGVPNYGSFAIPMLYSGLNGVLKWVALADWEHTMSDLLQFAKWFVGTWEMLPFAPAKNYSPLLFQAATYGLLNVPPDRLTNAANFQTALPFTVPTALCSYIAGYGHSTADGVLDWNNLTSSDGYSMTAEGDGTVPHSLGLVTGVTTYFVNELHANLPANKSVVAAVADLLATGATAALPQTMPSPTAGLTALLATGSAQTLLHLAHATENARTAAAVRDLRDRILTRITIAPSEISQAEMQLEEIMYTGTVDH